MSFKKLIRFTNAITIRTSIFACITLLCAGFIVNSPTNLVNTGTRSYQQNKSPLPGWAFGGFVRSPGVNPVILPNTTTRFDCPMKKVTVAWESNDTFNPGAVVKDG